MTHLVTRPALVLGSFLAALSASCAGAGPATHARRVASILPSASVQRRLDLTSDVPAAVLQACRRLARTYHGVVYCPPLVPAGKVFREYVGPWTPGRRYGSASYILDFISPSLQHIRGRPVDANGGHWVVEAGTDPGLSNHAGLYVPRRDWHGRISVTSSTLAGQRVAVYRISSQIEALFSGHDAVLWRHHGVLNLVSIHGHPNLPRTLAMARAVIRLQQRCGNRHTNTGPCALVFDGGG